jgi:hypothetical protein
MATVNQVFQSAPMGRRVYLSGIFAVGVLLVGFCVNSYFVLTRVFQHAPIGGRVIQALAPVLPLFILAATFMFERSRISKFSIEENVLVLGRKRYPLPGLLEVGKDSEVLKRARKRSGNGGLGAIRGKFRSKRLGNFDAFLSGTENAVVLKWPDRVVAVSPADPEFFIYSARAAAGLR